MTTTAMHDHVWMTLPTPTERARLLHVRTVAAYKSKRRARVSSLRRTPAPIRSDTGRFGGRMVRHDIGVIVGVR
jgi:hypothetical protein